MAELRLSMSEANFQTWFKGKTAILSTQGGVIEIGCANSYGKAWLEQRYFKELKTVLDRITGTSNNLVFKVSSQAVGGLKKRPTKKPVRTVPLLEGETEDSFTDRFVEAGLNRKYSLSTFLVGSSNQLAFAAAKAVVDSPFDRYNPLLVHGGVGVGKTHLLQAIGQAVILRHAGIKVLYSSSETFTNDMVEAIQRRQTFDFREKYRTVDLLIIDDVQFLAGRESTQEQFFHTFNHLILRGKQVVLSCDRDPKDLHGLQDRLKSRFSGGMVASIDPPDRELREAVLLSRARQEGLVLDRSVVRLLAKVLGPSIREVEGGLTRLAAISKLTGKPIDEAAVLQIIGSEHRPAASPKPFLEAAAKYFSVSLSDLCGNKRNKTVSFPRQVSMYLLRKNLKLPLKEIGRLFGNKNHTTILYTNRRVESLLKTDPEVRRVVLELENKVFGK